jgi:hypothetical protein
MEKGLQHSKQKAESRKQKAGQRNGGGAGDGSWRKCGIAMSFLGFYTVSSRDKIFIPYDFLGLVA